MDWPPVASSVGPRGASEGRLVHLTASQRSLTQLAVQLAGEAWPVFARYGGRARTLTLDVKTWPQTSPKTTALQTVARVVLTAQ